MILNNLHGHLLVIAHQPVCRVLKAHRHRICHVCDTLDGSDSKRICQYAWRPHQTLERHEANTQLIPRP